MKKSEVYKVVYDTVTREALNPDCKVIEGHKNFAKKLPDPQKVPEDDAAFYSVMVVYCPSNDWGLEGFFRTRLANGELLGDFVRNNIPEYNQYFERISKWKPSK